MVRFAAGFRRAVLACLAATMALGAAPAGAQKKDVKMMLDWIVQGTHAPFFVAKEKGYFKEGGLDVGIEAGRGATNVAVIVAGGAYDFGWVDLPTMIKFNAQNPGSPLIATYISFDDTPLAIITLLQGLGRLIRTRSDRGVLAILDPRLARMSYGRRFLGSLPPAPLTDDLEAITRFLAP